MERETPVGVSLFCAFVWRRGLLALFVHEIGNPYQGSSERQQGYPY